MGVITVGAFEALGGANVIQDKVTIKGTARYQNDDLEQFMYEEIEKVAQSVAVGFDITYDLDILYFIIIQHKPIMLLIYYLQVKVIILNSL